MNQSGNYILADKKMIGISLRSLKLSLLFSCSLLSGFRSSPSAFSLCEHHTVTSRELEGARGRGRTGTSQSQGVYSFLTSMCFLVPPAYLGHGPHAQKLIVGDGRPEAGPLT